MEAAVSNGGAKMDAGLYVPEEFRSRNDAVWVRGAFKTYGSGKNTCPVLHNMNMSVKEGTIYALLGASGCGKTTLLSCVVGRHMLDSGDVRVFGHTPGTEESGVPGSRVGYMPQDMSLYPEFSVYEMLVYFGHIHGMNNERIRSQMTFLLRFLQLPHKKRIISTLSGGQQRRVSFAVALLHEPELLILDEPTVGVDPLLRQTIWNHLRDITAQGKQTVMLTTHYIEEARQAQMVGMMRSGHLLAQNAPDVLMESHSVDNLEDVFLSLCVKDEAGNPPESSADILPKQLVSRYGGGKEDRLCLAEAESGIVGLGFSKISLDSQTQDGTASSASSYSPPSQPITNKEITAKCHTPLKPHRISAVLKKNFLRAWHNIPVVIFFCVLPMLLVLLFCMVVGGDPKDLNLAVVNGEWPDEPICQPFDDCLFINLSCRYISHLDHEMVTLVPYKDDASAVAAVQNGDAWGVLTFPEEYSDSLTNRILDGVNVDNHTVLHSIAELRMDMSNQQIAFMVQRMVVLRFSEFVNGLLELCDMNPALGSIPVEFGKPIFGSNSPLFMEFVAPGILINIVFALSMALAAGIFVHERMEGMLERAWIAGVSAGELLTAQLATQYVFMLSQIAGVLGQLFIFGVPIVGSIPWVIVLAILQGTCGVACGFFISAVCQDMTMVTNLAVVIFYPTFLLSGTLWPLESVHPILRIGCYVLPSTLATEALRSIMGRGWGIDHIAVWPGFLVSIGWIVFFLVATLFALKHRRTRFA